jgi:hypothetical protein
MHEAFRCPIPKVRNRFRRTNEVAGRLRGDARAGEQILLGQRFDIFKVGCIFLESQSIAVRQALVTSSLEGYPRSFPRHKGGDHVIHRSSPFSKARYPLTLRKFLLSTFFNKLSLPLIYLTSLQNYVELLSIGLTLICGFPQVLTLHVIKDYLQIASFYVKPEICKLHPARL